MWIFSFLFFFFFFFVLNHIKVLCFCKTQSGGHVRPQRSEQAGRMVQRKMLTKGKLQFMWVSPKISRCFIYRTSFRMREDTVSHYVVSSWCKLSVLGGILLKSYSLNLKLQKHVIKMKYCALMFWCKLYTHISIQYMTTYKPPPPSTFKCAYCYFILHDWTWLYSLTVEGCFRSTHLQTESCLWKHECGRNRGPILNKCDVEI